ncbi:MAG: hypothetical protein J6L64_00170 [Opitutales bacterium]|nr:hypothetical protein [Opitutales bacterium]
MSKIEILDNGEMWDVVPPRAAADVAARFEALDAEREHHYAAMAAAGVLPEEAPFLREREWRELKEGSGRNAEAELKSGKVKKCWRWLARRFSGAAVILAFPAVGIAFSAMVAWAMIAEEGGF